MSINKGRNTHDNPDYDGLDTNAVIAEDKKESGEEDFSRNLITI